ncbi:MAG: MFS transporter, partial [Nitrospirales bacterium]
IYGRGRLYGIGFAIFALGSLLCGLSQNILQLILFRTLQGIGAAMTQSVSRALASEAMPENQQSKVQGLMTTAFHTGFLLGPTIGGLIIDYVHWRAVFFVLVPVALVGSGLAFWQMKTFSRPTKIQPIDYLGAFLLITLTISLILVLDQRIRLALPPEFTIPIYFAFPALLYAFLMRELKFPSPIVNLSLFKIRMFTFSSITLLIVSFTHSMAGFLLPFYLQEVLHLTPTFMGILFLSAPVFTISLAPISGHVADRIGPKIPATVGVIVMMISVFIGVLLKPDSHWIIPAAVLAFTGLSSGIFNAPNHGAIMGSVPNQYRGFANGAINVCFNLSHILGISFTTFMMTLTYRMNTGQETARVTAEDPTAFVSSLNATFFVGFLIASLALIPSLMRGQKRDEGLVERVIT